ncbi:MAG: hypothetical protein GY856_23725 [bacterium]|nr:hypothetical protein [bacterium]
MFESNPMSFDQPFGELPGDECDPQRFGPEPASSAKRSEPSKHYPDGEPEQERRMLLRLGANGF